jgi:UDP-glucuronate 4-epimerase
MKKNIFITGAAGFIGFHLARSLHARGDHVIGYDNFNDYYDPALKIERANELKRLGVKVIKGDINQKEKLFKAIKDHKTTHLAHMAAQAGVRYSLINPQAYVKSNLEGFLNILEACRHSSIKLTYASSSSVYGLNTKVPFSITDPCDSQASLYGATKKSNELMAHTYHHLFGVPVTGLRFFTVYGPWGRPDMAYFSFSKAILEGKPIEIFNHGRMQRDFTYIDDIIDGTIAALDLESPYELFNLGNHKPEKLMAMIKILEDLLGKKAKKILAPMQPGDVLTTYADIEHSQSRLGFQPKTSLKAGLKKFVEWYLERQKAECGRRKAEKRNSERD